MKKLATLFVTMAVGLGNALAQGTIAFQNIAAFPLLVQDASGTTKKIGDPTGPLGPSSTRVALFVGPTTATRIDQMTMVGLTTNSPSLLPSGYKRAIPLGRGCLSRMPVRA